MSRNLWKGLLAGAIAGLVATAAKTAAEKLYPPRTHGEPEPPEELAGKLGADALGDEGRHVAAEAIHWGFGVTAGAFYGALTEFYPAAASKGGAAFGLTLMTLTHDTALPAMGLAANVDEQTPREHTSEAATHVIYGVVTEKVRHFVREALD